MSSSTIKSFSEKTGKTEREIEQMYHKAKQIAIKSNREDDYAYITGVLKNMLNLNENSFRSHVEFLNKH